MKTRQEIIDEAKRLRAEISQVFLDVGYWNTHVRTPDEAEIHPDPDGTLARLAASIDAMLEREGQS